MKSKDNIHARELRKGNTNAFKEVSDSLYGSLYVYAKSFVQDESDAEELVQEAFIMIWERRKNIDSDFNIKAYLYKSIHNQALNYLRHLKVVGQHVDEAFYFGQEEFQSPTEINPFLSKALTDAIDLLPRRTKLIFEMSRLDGLRHKEIAVELGISEKTVEVQVRKARQFLQKKLKRYYREL